MKTGVKTSGKASRSANQRATAASKTAVVANASAARARRVSSDSSPVSRSSCRTRPYWSGRETAATCAKFFAAPRSIVGPPMSIISTASCSWVPYRVATSRKG